MLQISHQKNLIKTAIWLTTESLNENPHIDTKSPLPNKFTFQKISRKKDETKKGFIIFNWVCILIFIFVKHVVAVV